MPLSYSNANGYRNPDQHPDTYSHGYIYANAKCHIYADSDANEHANPNGYCDCNSNPDEHAYAYAFSNSNPDAVGGAVVLILPATWLM